MDDKIDLFAEAARFYQHRPPYPHDAIQWIVDELDLDGCGRMLDVGCGTGHVCFRFPKWFEAIVAIDPSEPMLNEARTIATCGGMADKFSFQKMHAEALPSGLGRFRLVTFGASFHRVRQEQVLEAVYEIIEPGGGLALLFPGVPWRGAETWKNVLRQTVQDWTGHALGGPFVPCQDAVRNSLFGGCRERDFHEDHAWSLEELAGYMRSTSFASSLALADRTEGFYHDLRSRLLNNRPDGLFPDVTETTVVVAVRKKHFDSGPVDSSTKRVGQQPHAADGEDAAADAERWEYQETTMKSTDDPTLDCAALVRDGYNRCADAYATARPDTPHRLLLTLVDELSIDATALDIGCGAGIPVSRVLATRASVTGIDISPRMIALARQNVPTVRFIEADIRAVDFPPESFDAVTAFYSIFHLPKEDHQPILGTIYSWLKPGGMLLCTLSYADEAAYTEDSFFGVTMYWSNHSLSQYDQMLTKLGFELLESTVLGSGFDEPENEDAEAHPLLLLRKPNPQDSQPAGAGDA